MKILNKLLVVVGILTCMAFPVTAQAAKTVDVVITDGSMTKSTLDDRRLKIKNVTVGTKLSSAAIKKVKEWVNSTKSVDKRSTLLKTAYKPFILGYKKEITEDNCKFTVQYKLIKPVIDYYNRDGSLYTRQYAEVGSRVKFPTPPTDSGLTFLRWKPLKENLTENMVINDIVHYKMQAVFDEPWYKIKFTAVNAHGSMGTTGKIMYTEKYTLPACRYTKTGFTFGRWKDESGKMYKAGDVVTKLTNQSGTTVTMTALWSRNTYKISYAYNGAAAITSNPTTFSYGLGIKLQNPVRTGYKFKGWTYDSKTTPVLNVNIASATFDKNIKFTANWEPIIYILRFDGNGATSGQMNNLRVKYGIKKDDSSTYLQLPKNVYKKDGYIFDGWLINGDSGKRLKDQQILKGNLTTKANDEIRLVASWKPNETTYKITYKLNGGVDGGNRTTFTPSTPTFAFINPTKKGYVFLGWSGSTFSGIKAKWGINKGTIGNRTYTANWRPIEYTIVFEPNGGTGSMSNMTVKYDQNMSLPKCSFTKKGYVFDGWLLNGDTGKRYKDKQKISGGLTTKDGDEVRLVASWKADETTYNITYNLNGGVDGGNRTTFTPSTPTFAFINPTKKGYVFLGWTGSTFSGMKTKWGINMGTVGDRTYTANWRPIEYTIRFMPTLGSGSMGSIKVNYDQSVKLPKCLFTNNGYVFTRWVTKNKDASYQDQETVSNLTTTDGAEIALYAMWKKL